MSTFGYINILISFCSKVLVVGRHIINLRLFVERSGDASRRVLAMLLTSWEPVRVPAGSYHHSRCLQAEFALLVLIQGVAMTFL
jgi:hypothetical protein